MVELDISATVCSSDLYFCILQFFPVSRALVKKLTLMPFRGWIDIYTGVKEEKMEGGSHVAQQTKNDWELNLGFILRITKDASVRALERFQSNSFEISWRNKIPSVQNFSSSHGEKKVIRKTNFVKICDQPALSDLFASYVKSQLPKLRHGDINADLWNWCHNYKTAFPPYPKNRTRFKTSLFVSASKQIK